MVKKREVGTVMVNATLLPPQSSPIKKHHKKHKKHKKKSSSHKVSSYDGIVEIDIVSDLLPKQNAKFKLSPSSSSSIVTQTSASSNNSKSHQQQKKRKNRGKDSGTSSDEERWLDAIESGKLEEVDDELKKIKDPKLMTARQRAMYERSADKEFNVNGNGAASGSSSNYGSELLMSLPTGYKEKVMTAEAIQKAQLKSQKRKQLADEKREKDKKKTMERLLKKQESTKCGKQAKCKIIRTYYPAISYKNTLNGATITFPSQNEIPVKSLSPRESPKIVLCSNPGCKSIKSYNCSRTNLPLCSFACYKKNIALLDQIMC